MTYKLQILVSVEELQAVAAAAKFLARPAPIVTVCAWCPTKDHNDKVLAAHGFKVSHGMCSACAKQGIQ